MPALKRSTDLPFALHVPRAAEARLEHLPLAGNRAVGRERRIAQERARYAVVRGSTVSGITCASQRRP